MHFFRLIFSALSLFANSGTASPTSKGTLSISRRALDADTPLFHTVPPGIDQLLWLGYSENYAARRPTPTYTINRWLDIIPERCYFEAAVSGTGAGNTNAPPGGWCPDLNELSVFEVKYSDAARPWLFCRCANAGVPEATLIEKIGKVPPGIRQHARYIMAWNGSGSANGLATRHGDFMVFSDVILRVYMHELAHLIDYSDDNTESFQFSSSAEFLQAVNQDDACWLSDYGKEAWIRSGKFIEEWAEAFWYSVMLPGYNGNPDRLYDDTCLNGQLEVVRNQTDALIANYRPNTHAPYGPHNCHNAHCLKDAVRRSQL